MNELRKLKVEYPMVMLLDLISEDGNKCWLILVHLHRHDLESTGDDYKQTCLDGTGEDYNSCLYGFGLKFIG